MPPRPAGTDGTDHSYRMVIVDRYKRMAEFKSSIEKLIALHLVFVLVKLAWHYAAFALQGIEVPKAVLGLVAGELLLLAVYNMARLGTVKESLFLLKTFNMVQAIIAATQVLSGWQYHQGTNSDGVPTYENAAAVAKHAGRLLPAVSPDQLLAGMKVFELFLDLTLAAFVVMGAVVSHKMIVEKMEMKKDKKNVRTDRKDAQKGGSDDDSSSDDEAAPAAVPLQEEAKVVKAAATSKTQAARRRHA